MKGASKRYREEVAARNELIKEKRLKSQMKHAELESKEKARKRIKAAQDVAKAAHKKKMRKMIKTKEIEMCGFLILNNVKQCG